MQQEGFHDGDGTSDENRHSIREDEIVENKLLSERDPNGEKLNDFRMKNGSEDIGF